MNEQKHSIEVWKKVFDEVFLKGNLFEDFDEFTFSIRQTLEKEEQRNKKIY